MVLRAADVTLRHPFEGHFVTSVQTSRTIANIIYYCIFRDENAVFIARIEQQQVMMG